jgi:hypothetical protein
MFKNIVSTGITGAAFGLLMAAGFEWSIGLGLITGLLFGIAIGVRLTFKPPRMRYPMFRFRRIMVAAAVFLMGALIYSYLLDQPLSRFQAFLAILLPLAGWAAVVIFIGQAIASMDEMQRRIQIEAIAIAFAGTAILVGGYALLGFADYPQINWGVVIMLMSVMWLAGKLWTLWRYK